MIRALRSDYPVTLLSDLLDYPRSSFYYQPQPCPEDLALVEAIEDILMRWPFYGYRRVLHQLKREWDVGETRVRRLLKWLGATRQVGRVRIQTTDSQHDHQRYPNRIKGVQPTAPNQIWVADLTYIRLSREFIYLAVVLDAFSRAVRGWQVSQYLTCEALTLPALKMALNHGSPAIFHSDQGKQYAASCHLDSLRDRGVQISMADKGKPAQNGLVERFIRTVKEEHVDYTEYTNVQNAIRQLKQWLEIEYMTERIHSSLGYLTPAEFEAAAASPMAQGFTNLA